MDRPEEKARQNIDQALIGAGQAYQTFGIDLLPLLEELNEVLAA